MENGSRLDLDLGPARTTALEGGNRVGSLELASGMKGLAGTGDRLGSRRRW